MGARVIAWTAFWCVLIVAAAASAGILLAGCFGILPPGLR